MEFSSPIPRQQVGRTFLIAIGVLGVCALAQLGAVAWVFISKNHASSAVEPPLPAGPTKSGAAEKLVLTDPFASTEPTPAPALAEAAPAPTAPQQFASLPKPTPVTANPEARLDDLIQQSRVLREKGDTSTALTFLRQAQTMSPESALVISELATTFEKMGQTDKAMEQWRRIFEMGESAGIYYQAADAKLKASDAMAQASVKHEGTDISGIQPGSILGLGEITSADVTEGGGPKKFMLKIPLKARPNSSIEVKDVIIQVYFYDMVDGASLMKTNASVSYRWITPTVDWKDDDIEILQVDYAQSPPKLGSPAEHRVYFGYVVWVYYKGELQDWRADQDKLRAKFPPPLTLPADQMP